MPTKTVKTEIGTFNVNIDDNFGVDISTMMRVKTGTLLSIGGSKHSCIHIRIPTTGDTGTLDSIEMNDGGCEVFDKPISGDKTITLINFAFTIVKEMAPHIKYLQLEDGSSFTCKLSNGSNTAKISLAIYELAFHQQTWYERHFGAVLVLPYLRERYEAAKQKFHTPIDPVYDFRNKHVSEELTNMYADSPTWYDFFQKVYTLKNKCEVMFPWYKDMVKHIMNGELFERRDWIIDIYGDIIIDVPYTEISGGRRRRNASSFTRRRRRGGAKTAEPLPEIPYGDIYDLKIPVY